jgi:hypothetical protein
VIPTETERREARALYTSLLSETRTLGELRESWPANLLAGKPSCASVASAYLNAARCVDITIRIADGLAEFSSGPGIDRTVLAPRDDETPKEWIDRVTKTIGGSA